MSQTKPLEFEIVGRLHYARQVAATIADTLGQQADDWDEDDGKEYLLDDVQAAIDKIDEHLRPMLLDLLGVVVRKS